MSREDGPKQEWYLGVMHAKGGHPNYSDIIDHFEDLPMPRFGLVYLPYVYETEMAEPVTDPLKAYVYNGNAKPKPVEQSLQDIVLQLAKHKNTPIVVVVNIGYLAVKHFLESQFPEGIHHLGRKFHLIAAGEKRKRVYAENSFRNFSLGHQK